MLENVFEDVVEVWECRCVSGCIRGFVREC